MLWNGTGGIFPEGPRGGFYDGGNVKWSFGGYYRNSDVAIDLSPESLAIKWVSIRNEQRKNFEFLAESALALELQDSFEETFLGIRQTSWNFSYSVTVDLTELKSGDVFGLAAYIKEGAYLSLEIKRGMAFEISVQAASGNQPSASISTDQSEIQIEIIGNDQDYTFTVNELNFMHTLDGREISCDMTDSHTGVMIAFIGKSEFKSKVKLSNFRS